jgi:ribosome maturation factor RimP
MSGVAKDFREKIVEAITPITSSICEERGLHLLRMAIRGAQHTPVIEIVIDGARPVSIEDCEKISRSLQSVIELEQLVSGNFRLDVMSPGLEEPIVHEWQFKKNLGKLVEAHYAEDGQTHTVHGHLRDFSELVVSIEPLPLKRGRGTRPSAPGVPEIHVRKDEQAYQETVELVVLERAKLTKLQAVPVFS